MNSPAPLDQEEAHKYFSATCFNQAWDLIAKEPRSERENQLLVALSQASIYHWMQRPGCTDQNLSVGYWQASRIHALLGHAAEARRLAEVCLSYSKALAPFFLGYAHEAMARAEGLAGNATARDQYLSQAHKLADNVLDAEERSMLEADLQTVNS